MGGESEAMQDGKVVPKMGKACVVLLTWITASAGEDGSKDAEIELCKRLV